MSWLLIFVCKIDFYKDYFRDNFRVSNSLDPDQALLFVRPGPEVIKLFHAQLS